MITWKMKMMMISKLKQKLSKTKPCSNTKCWVSRSRQKQNSNIFGRNCEMTHNKNEEMGLIDRDATLSNPRKRQFFGCEDRHKKYDSLIRSMHGSIHNQKEAKLHNTQSVFFHQNFTYHIHNFRPLYIVNRLGCWKANNHSIISVITPKWLVIQERLQFSCIYEVGGWSMHEEVTYSFAHWFVKAFYFWTLQFHKHHL